jgi:hypothetical protein
MIFYDTTWFSYDKSFSDYMREWEIMQK